MARPHVARTGLLIAAVLGLMTVQAAAPEPEDSLLWSEAFNAGHAPLYGLVALVILRLLGSLRLSADGSGRASVRLYLLAFVLTVACGLAVEGLQSLGFGDAEIGDVARDGLGAAAFLLAISALDPKLSDGKGRFPRAARFLVAALLLGLAFFSWAETAVALLRRDAAFPTICSFDSSWETKFVSAREADLERTLPPESWGRDSMERVARLAFHKGTWPGLSIQHLHRDWSGYNELVFEVYSELSQPVELVLTIHDVGHDREYYDRFNKELTVVSGANRISIPLREMQMAPRGREMDLSRMCGLVLFADHPEEPFILYLDAFRLE